MYLSDMANRLTLQQMREAFGDSVSHAEPEVLSEFQIKRMNDIQIRLDNGEELSEIEMSAPSEWKMVPDDNGNSYGQWQYWKKGNTTY